MASQSLSRLKNILVAVDGSEHSFAAVKHICDFSIGNIACPECLVTIIGVLNPLDAAVHASYKPPLQKAQKLLQERCYQVKTELILGYPAEVLITYAEENQPDLIVIGAKGLRATLGILLGGVAQQVIEYARCPVLIVRAPYHPLKNVMLVTDGSLSSLTAAEYLSSFPLTNNVKLFIVHVLKPDLQIKPDLLMQTWSLSDDIIASAQTQPLEIMQVDHDAEEKQGRQIVDQSQKLLETTGLPISTALLRGDAATEIINFSQTNDIDLIVAGSRGLSEMKAWLLGSVSRKLVHYAQCSVLIVRK